MPRKTPSKNKKKIEEEEIEEEEIENEQEEENDKETETPKKKKRSAKKNKKDKELEDAEEENQNEEKKSNKKKKKSEKEETEENEENEENNNITEDKKVHEKEKQKKEEEEKDEEMQEQNEQSEEEVKTKKINNKQKKSRTKKEKTPKKVSAKNKKSKKKSKKQVEEEEEENESEEKEEEELEEEIEEQETSPTEIKKSKKKKAKKDSNLHVNKKFEKELNLAYKKLLKIIKYTNEQTNEEEEDDEENEEESDEEKTESELNSDMQYCEKKLRSALNICKNDPIMIINANIIEKLNKIALLKKANVNYILGNIYTELMSKEFLFDYNDEDNFDMNVLISFINNAIKFREEMKNAKIQIIYDEALKNFLFFITEQFELEKDQLKNINKILDEETDIDHSNLKTNKTFNVFIESLNTELESQPNIYEQYEIFIQNKKAIIKLIEECDPEEKDNYNDYLKLGKTLAYMFFNPSVNMYIQKNSEIEKEEEEEELGEMLLFYDGEENRGEMNIVNGEKFCISLDNKIKEYRKKLGEIIIKYSEQFIDIIDEFSIQYIIFILLSRLYSCNYKKYVDEINPIFAESIINMCFFKNSPLRLINIFINKILESENPENEDLKNLLLIKINEAKENEEFLYEMPEELEKKYKDKKIKYDKKKKSKKSKKKKSKKAKGKQKENDEEEEEEEDDDDDLGDNKIGEKFEDIINEENLFVLHNDLKLGYFNKKVIKARDKFIFFEEINQDYSLLDFCVNLEEYDIKFTITDVTEGKELYSKEKLIANEETPLKIVMFFSTPRILKFEFDNSYSWVRSKTITYKTNIFYPKFPYLISHHISLGQYIGIISRTKKDIAKKKNKGKNKVFNDDSDKMLIIKINEKNKVFNCVNVKDNLEAINSLIKKKYLSILSLFIRIKDEKNEQDKSYFYCYSKEKKELIENELTQEIFENALNKLSSNENTSLTIVNLYVINNNLINNINYANIPIRKLLGFEPISSGVNNDSKIIYFVQSLNQAQLLYCLYKQINNNESVDEILLLNYSKYSGYQIGIFDTEEILDSNECFNGLNKKANLEEDVNLIVEGIKKFDLSEERKVLVVICPSIDEKEEEIVPEKLEEKLKEILGKEENGMKNVCVIKADNDFINEMKNYSHIFYLQN